MTAWTDKQIKVSMELADGRVFAGRCLMSTINVQNEMDDITSFGGPVREFAPRPLSWDMNLQGVGRLVWYMGSSLAPSIATRILPHDWECEYCGRANPIKDYQCGSCGWYRGVVVDVVNELGVWKVKR